MFSISTRELGLLCQRFMNCNVFIGHKSGGITFEFFEDNFITVTKDQNSFFAEIFHRQKVAEKNSSDSVMPVIQVAHVEGKTAFEAIDEAFRYASIYHSNISKRCLELHKPRAPITS